MAEWENVPLDPTTKKKKKKKQRVNLEPPRPMAARLKTTTTCKPRTASAYGRAVNKQRVNLEPPRPTAARLKRQSVRTLMYLLFPLSGLDPGVHLGDCLWKVSNIK